MRELQKIHLSGQLKENFKKNNEYSKQKCNYDIASPDISTNEEVGQPNLECEQGTPTSTSLLDCRINYITTSCRLTFTHVY